MRRDDRLRASEGCGVILRRSHPNVEILIPHQNGGNHPFIRRFHAPILRRMTARYARQRAHTTTFAVERYWPGVTNPGLVAAAAAARDAAKAMADAGLVVRFVDAFVARDDQVVVTVFEAASREAAQAAVDLAGLPYDRITQLDRARGTRADGTCK